MHVYDPTVRRLSVFWAVVVLLFLVAHLSPAAEFRGLWVDAFGPGFLSSNEVTRLVSDCRKYNFNALIVEMRLRGDAFYLPHQPNPDPRTTVLSDDFDALAEIIRQCHNGTPRIEVHCWLVSHFIWAWKRPPPQPNHVFNLHPEYLTKDSIGEKLIGTGYFLDPGNPDANRWIHDVAMDVAARYEIDGLHWDYCRYPAKDSGYNEVAVKRYNEEFGLTGEPSPNDQRFCEWRRRQVTDFLRWVNSDLLAIKPRLALSVAVFSNYQDSYGYRLADWTRWNDEGIIDLCMPMDFSADNQHIFNPRADFALVNQGSRRVCLGQGAYLNTQQNTLAQLAYARSKGFLGTVFYSYRSPGVDKSEQEAVFTYVKENFQPSWTETPALPWKKSMGVIKGTVTRQGSGEPIYNAAVTLTTRATRTQQTEPHGNYAFFNVEAGSCALGVGDDGKGAEVITIRPGEVRTVNFVLGNPLTRSKTVDSHYEPKENGFNQVTKSR